MEPGSPGRHGRAVAGVTGFVVLAGAGVAALAASGAAPAAVTLLAATGVAALAGILGRILARTSTALRRLAADTAVIADANPSHRLAPAGTDELDRLAATVNRLAEERESAQRRVAEQVEAARRDMEAERNRLAALMAQLTVAVLVCNGEGRILLYNEAARSLVGEATPVGLGRSVFGVVDRGLVAHAHDRLTAGAERVHTATTLIGDRLIRVRVTLVPEAAADPHLAGSGFVLVLDDLTREVRAGDRRERLLRRLTEETRASLGSIRAAVESVLEFPELTGDERQRFLEIVRGEADRLGRGVEDLATESGRAADDPVLTDIAGEDLLGVLRNELSRAGIACDEEPPEHDLWLRADVHAVARTVVHLATRLARSVDAGPLTLQVAPAGHHGQLDARWPGRAPAASVVEEWLDEPLDAGGTSTARDVADRHSGEIWCGDLGGETAYLRVLLPLAGGTPPPPRPGSGAAVTSRPEFYDFDLFTAREASAGAGRPLDAMAFTVFDTETTGLDPAGGDRVISIGAVRVVNGRVLRRETFESLVQPGRDVPGASTAIHGITADMLEGAPPIEQVLPAFARFAEDTVLVGHNVAFDLRFLRPGEASSGVRLTQPALDTLLLHAALHPDHEDHTLEALAERLGVSVVGRHTALGDALVTAEVFVGLLPLLRRNGVDTLAGALTVARRTYLSRADESPGRG